MKEVFDVVIIGGGQSALACAYYLRRLNLNYLILEKQQTGGGAWQHGWDSLTLFSPAEHSSLPGWQMPASANTFPTKDEVIRYLREYENRYQLPVQYDTEVINVRKDNHLFQVRTSKGELQSKTVISATGTWERPFIPVIQGQELFSGKQLHSAFYKNANPFTGLNVLIVGEGNTGAQLLAEVSKVAHTEWATNGEPSFLPDEVDGFVLFSHASAQFKSETEGKELKDAGSLLGNIVMVPSVREARERGVLHAAGSIAYITENGIVWQNGNRESFDVIIWCTGYCYATDVLSGLMVFDERGKAKTIETKSVDVPGLWLVGYGSWTGFASATLIGVGRTARQTAQEIDLYLKHNQLTQQELL
jgi:putative flavoprotein involved in K+ transport